MLRYVTVVAIATAFTSMTHAAPPPATPPMVEGRNGWTGSASFTVSDIVGGFQATGILDGLGAFPKSSGKGKVLILANSELNEGNGYPYALANGTQLTGARVNTFELNWNNRRVTRAGLAYDTIYDRRGDVVTDPSQVNEDGFAIDGFARLCSARGVAAGTYGLVDDVFFTGEETSKPFHPHGGTEWAVNVRGCAIWAIPAMGRGGWENVTPIESGDENRVAFLLGDDVQSAPLYLFVGEKNALGDGSFLDRNGLAVGQLYAWASSTGELTPEDFNGTGSSLTGTWIPLVVQDSVMADAVGYDSEGYLDGDTLRAQADALGCFSFSRPEDLHDNPANPSQVVFASTGRGGLFPSDNWGTTYIVDIDLPTLTADLTILIDSDDTLDEGVRSPDNLTWSSDGFIYIQEDRSTSPASLFGSTSSREASIWQVDPITGSYVQIAEIDRSVVLPLDATDGDPTDLGDWETSGILDVTEFFRTVPGETLLIATVQAHSIRDGSIGDNPLLDEGGQLIFLSNR